jgi:hypothetical protein
MFRWCCFAVALLGALAVGTARASASVPASTLPLRGFGHILVDESTQQVFVTGSSSDTSIAVEGLDGLPEKTIPNEAYASGMALVGSTLYVARCGEDAIDEIDTATDQRVGTLTANALPSFGSCDLAYAGGLLWYVDDSTGDLASVTLTPPGTVTVTSVSANAEGEQLRASPANPDDLLLTGAGAALYDVSNPASPSVIASNAAADDLYGDGVFSPSGSDFFDTRGTTYADEFALPGLTLVRSYSSALVYPDAVEAVGVSPDGTDLAAGWRDPTASTGALGGVVVYPIGGTSASESWAFSMPVAEYGLAYADNHTIYAITDPGSTETPRLHVLSTLPAASVSITSSAATVNEGGGATLTAHLGTSSTNRGLSIYRYADAGGPPKLVYSGTVGPRGNITYIVHPETDTSYAAIWTGDSTHAATGSSLVNIHVVPAMNEHLIGAYGISGVYRLFHYSAHCVTAHTSGCPLFGLTVAPNLARQIVQVQLQEYLSGAWRLAVEKRYNLSSTSSLGVYFYYSGTGVENIPTRVRAVFAGDPYVVNPATGKWMYFKVTR